MTRATIIGPLSALVWMSVGCQEPRVELREWRASDHQPPPAVAPEGQGAGEEDEGADSPQRAAAALWGMRCASCHGLAGRGDGEGRPQGASLPDLSSEAFQSTHDDAQLMASITQGKGLMPAFRTELTPEGIQAMVGYIRALRAPAPAAQP